MLGWSAVGAPRSGGRRGFGARARGSVRSSSEPEVDHADQPGRRHRTASTADWPRLAGARFSRSSKPRRRSNRCGRRAQTPAMIEPTKAPPRKTTPTKIDAKDPRSRVADQGRRDSKGHGRSPRPAPRDRASACRRGPAARAGTSMSANFCCPGYLATMKDQISRNWSSKQGTRCGNANAVRGSARRAHCRHHRRAIERPGRPRLPGVSARLLAGEAARRCRRSFRERCFRSTCAFEYVR